MSTPVIKTRQTKPQGKQKQESSQSNSGSGYPTVSNQVCDQK